MVLAFDNFKIQQINFHHQGHVNEKTQNLDHRFYILLENYPFAQHLDPDLGQGFVFSH